MSTPTATCGGCGEPIERRSCSPMPGGYWAQTGPDAPPGLRAAFCNGTINAHHPVHKLEGH